MISRASNDFCSEFRQPGRASGPAQNAPKHRSRQLSRKGVLLARVVGRDEGVAADPKTRPVAKSRARPRQLVARLCEDLEAGLEGHQSEGDENARRRQEGHLARQVRTAAGELGGQRPVERRRAPASGRDQRSRKLQAVIPPPRLGLIGETGLEEGSEEEIAGFVASEDPARSVSPVGRGREADYENPRPRVAEGRKRPPPVRFSPEPARRILRGELPPGDESRAAFAGDDLPLDAAQRVSLRPTGDDGSGAKTWSTSPSTWRARGCGLPSRARDRPSCLPR